MFFFFVDPKKLPAFSPGMGRFEQAVDEFREVDGTVSVNTLATFLHVSRRLAPVAGGSMSLRDISTEMGVPHSSFVRHIAILGEGTAGSKKLGLLETGIQPDGDRRERSVILTDKGLKLLRKIDRHLGEVD
jgi:DNA-binding MarR family transcriptional regulator